jgi:hypothetical protein
MKRKYWLGLAPSLVVGTGIVASTYLAVLAAGYGLMVLIGPLLLAFAIVSADILDSRMRRLSSSPSPAALIMGSTFMMAGLIVALRDPGLTKTLIPIMGTAAWVVLLLRPENRRKTCAEI